MYRIMIICVLIEATYAGVILPEQQLSNQLPLIADGTIHSSIQNNNSHSLPYPTYPDNYPIYPEHTKTEYAVQTEYYEKSYIAPTAVSTQIPRWSFGSVVYSLLLPISSKLILYSTRVGIYVLQFLFFVLLSSVFTTAICTFTPICNITYPGLGIDADEVKEQIAELTRIYMTPENLNVASFLATKVIDYYAALQYGRDEKGKQDKAKDATSNKMET